MDVVSILGICAGAFTTFSFFPQAYKTIKTRDTKGISLHMYSILVAGIALWVAYGIAKTDIPVILANSITLFPAMAILIMKIRSKQ